MGDRPAQIGRYKVVDELGHGGFGTVYRAFDPSVGRPVAIKVLTERGRDVLSRFRNEATVAGNLHHENIVTVYEYGEYEGQPYLAMQYLEGEDLQHIITSRKPLTLLEKCNIMWQVAEGLDCAHRAGVVHRDVKPANIMVLRDGTAKIMDFGIARVTRDTQATRLTQQGYVLGTLIYMSPEQFAGSEIDALCDIFAYGVIYYELLTGRHPFEAPDPRALMYKISFEDPPPIGDFVSDCPPGLQAIIGRILHKDRELRYQSLKEVQYDVEPIRLDLQRQRAGALVAQAQELYEKKQLDPAHSVVLEALGLDPSNTVARSLKENLHKQLQQRTLQPRIESTLSAAEEHLAQRRFSDAIQSFEAALRLDRESAYIQNRLEQARALLEHSRAAAALLNEARQEFQAQNFTAAYRSVSEALRHDPQNPEAAELLNSIQGAVERRQREQRVEDAVRKAEGLILLRSFDEAEALLTELGDDARTPKIDQLLDWIRKQKAEQSRRQRLQSEMAAATDLLRTHRLGDAADRLEALQAEFPDSKEVADLLAYARREVEAEARAKAVEQITAKAGALARDRNYDSAMTTLEEGLRKFPGENALIRLLGSVMAAKGDWERERAVETTMRECERLRSQNRFAEAIELLEATLREYSAEPELARLLEELEKAWAEHRHAEAVRKAAEQARGLLEQGRPGDALHSLRQALLQHPGEPDLAALLERAQQEVLAIQRAQAIQGIGREAAMHAEAHDFDQALSALERGIRSWGEDEGLLGQRAAMQEAKARWEEQRAVREAVDSARQFAARKQFAEAQQAIEAAQRQYPGSAELAEAAEHIRREAEQQKRRDAVLSIASEVRLLVSRGRLDEAMEALREALEKYPGEADLQAVEQQARQALEARQRAEAVERLVRQSEELAAARQYDRAREALERGLAAYPGELALARQLGAVKAAAAAWQRELAVQEIVAEAKALARDGRYDAALQLLSTSPVYSPSLLDAQRELEREREQHERREAIAKAVAGVKAMLERGRPEEALRVLRELSRQYAGEPDWEQLAAQAQEQLEERRRAEERKRAIQDALRSAEEMAGRSRHEEALERLDESLRRFEGEAVLVEAQRRIRLALEARRRAEAVAGAMADANALIEQERYEDAVPSLREACARYPGEAGLRSLLAQAEEKLAARERRNQAVADAGALLRQERFEDAAALLRPLAARYPSDAELKSLLSRAQEEGERRRREAAIAKVAEEAAALAAARDFDRALAVLDAALRERPGEQRLAGARESVRQAQLAWQRQQARDAAVQYLRKLAGEGRFEDGAQKAESLVREYPGDPELAALHKEFQMRGVLAQAGALLEKGEFARAIAGLEEIRAAHGAEPEWLAVMERANAAALAQARAAAIERKRRDARAKAEAGDVDGALAELEEALQKWPDEKSLLDARESAAAARAMRERQETIRNAVNEGERMERENRLPAALQYVERFLHECPGEPALAAIRDRIRAELEEQERRRSRQRDLKELEELDDWVRNGSSPIQISEALDLARRVAARHPGDEEMAAAGARTIRHFEDLQSAAAELAKGDFAAALEICARGLAARPGHPKFQELQAEAERRRKAAYLSDLQRRSGAENDLAARLRLLEEGAARYPDDQWIAGELVFTRNKLGLVEEILAKARACEAAGEWDQALEQWNTLATIYSRQPGLEDEIRRAQAARDRARGETAARWARLIDEQMQAGELGRARELLRQAVTELPDTPLLQALGRKIDGLRQKAKECRDLLSQAQAARESGDFQQCRARLRDAYRAGEHDPALRRLVLNRLAEHAEAALEPDWKQAETLAAEAAALDSGFALPGELLRGIAEHKREGAVEAALARAGQLRDAGDLRAALTAAEQGLGQAPGDTRLAGLREELAGRVAGERNRLSAELQRLAAAARQAAPGDVEPLQRRVSEIAAAVQGDPELAPLAAQTLRDLAARGRRLRQAQLWGRVVSRRKQIGGVAAGLALAAALTIGGWRLFRQAPTLPLEVRTAPPGAAVTVGAHTCTGPRCRFDLPAGAYEIRAQLEGYRPASHLVKLDAAGQSITVPLDPLPAAAQILTNFTSGRVSIDGRPAGELTNSQFTLDALPFGAHTIAVSSPDGEANVAFNASPGAMPALTGSVRTRNADAVVLSSMGQTGNVACDCPDAPVLIDGKPAGRIGADGLRIGGLAAGTRELQVGERNFVVGIRPEPELSIFLSADRPVGTLVVETNAPGAAILIDGKPAGTAGGRTPFQMPLAAGPHRVEVKSPGYRPAPPRIANVENRKTLRLSVPLDALKGQLAVLAAAAGTSVSIDGKPAGTVGPDGSLTVDGIEPGERNVGLARAGYAPKQMTLRFEAGRRVKLTTPAVDLSPDQNTLAEDRRKEEKASWDRVDKSNRAALQQFLNQNPNGAYAGDAKKTLAALDQQAQAERKREAEQREEAEWTAVNKADRTALQQFVDRRPNSPHAEEARGRLAQISEADRSAAAQNEAQQRVQQQQQTAEARAGKDAQQIRDALARYEGAYREKNAAALRSVFPEADLRGVQQQFKLFRSIEVRLQPRGEPRISGDTASVECEQAITAVDEQGRHRVTAPPTVTVRLKRGAAGWVIESFQ